MNIQEIARIAGVSAATVSRVFSHHPGIRPEIRSSVLEAARKHGYHPRFSDRQKNVVIITPYNSAVPARSCVEMILVALSQVLPERGFRLEILPADNLERLESIQFCGAVAIGGELSDFPDWQDRFPVPLLIVDRPAVKKRLQNVCFVRSDEEQGMFLAIEHLYRNGCRKIGCIIHGLPDRGNTEIRYKGIVSALKKCNLPVDERMLCCGGNGTEKYVELIGKLLNRGADALFCPGGNAGLAALYALDLFHKRVPEDLSLITSEQQEISGLTIPPLTTVSPDYPGLAGAVADVLEKYLDNEPPAACVTLPYRLIERESVRKRV